MLQLFQMEVGQTVAIVYPDGIRVFKLTEFLPPDEIRGHNFPIDLKTFDESAEIPEDIWEQIIAKFPPR
jgi:hypothetical protein